MRTVLAKTFAIPPENVVVIDPFVGGGFGCKGSAWSHVVIAALAAKAVGRPVKLVLERPQMFGPVGNRPRTDQTLALGADAAGNLLATSHATISETSMIEDWVETSSLPARMLYNRREQRQHASLGQAQHRHAHVHGARRAKRAAISRSSAPWTS